MIHEERIKFLNKNSIQEGQYVLYWMQQSQRAEYNHALEYSILKANEIEKPLVVFFGLTDNFPEANERHYFFMLEGLKEVKETLKKRGIQLVVKLISPELGAVEMSKSASLLITDRGYLAIQRKWRRFVAANIKCPLIQVESDVIFPIESVSAKEEYSAATIRHKIDKGLDYFMQPLRHHTVKKNSLNLSFDSLEINKLADIISKMKIERSVKKVDDFLGGTRQAKKHLNVFIDKKLERYEELRNDPTLDYLSNMSPFLHFGQISPLYIALKVKQSRSRGASSYLEELIVRRELSMNFVFYNRNYQSFKCLPNWSIKTLMKHRNDEREHIYSRKDFEEARTHDPYWNAAQKEMRIKGKMHGYMRMYWGKKIIEWTRTPQYGFKVALYLNNKYEIDGRDPNGFTGVAWCFGKHDRPWQERLIFGNIRYMNDKGLRRKFDADRYVKNINQLNE